MKIWAWLKDKWQLVVGFFLGLIALISVLLRSKQQKEVLDMANKSHEAENEANDKAREDLDDGLTAISKEKDKKLKEINRSSDEAEKNLEEEKKKFVEDAKKDGIGRKLADHLGVEFVDNDE